MFLLGRCCSITMDTLLYSSGMCQHAWVSQTAKDSEWMTYVYVFVLLFITSENCYIPIRQHVASILINWIKENGTSSFCQLSKSTLLSRTSMSSLTTSTCQLRNFLRYAITYSRHAAGFHYCAYITSNITSAIVFHGMEYVSSAYFCWASRWSWWNVLWEISWCEVHYSQVL